MMKARQIIEQASHSKFRQPENFDPVAEGAGWVMYAGGNDWEAGVTWVAVIFPSDEANRRVWFSVKHRNSTSDQPQDQQDQVKKHGDKAWRKWKQTGLAAHRNKNHGARSWLDAFKSAIKSRDMEPFVKEWGVDKTSWSAENTESCSLPKTARQLIDESRDTRRCPVLPQESTGLVQAPDSISQALPETD